MTNELSTGNHGNALTITEQFPEGKYNLLVPIKTVAEIAEIHKPVMNVVYISTNEADKEIYLQEKPDGWALTKKALTKLMKAAGIRIVKSEPLLPTKCEKCAAVNRGIGRPVNCGSCPNKDVKHQVTISMPQLTGENVEVVASKEILYDDVTVNMKPGQKAEFTKFRSEMCETKALNRQSEIEQGVLEYQEELEHEKSLLAAKTKNEAIAERINTVKSKFGEAMALKVDINKKRNQVFVTKFNPAKQLLGEEAAIEENHRKYEETKAELAELEAACAEYEAAMATVREAQTALDKAHRDVEAVIKERNIKIDALRRRAKLLETNNCPYACLLPVNS